MKRKMRLQGHPSPYLSFYRIIYSVIFFFFSSRRRHTRSLRDWSSDVCSSDLVSEHLRLDQVLRDRCAVHAHEGLGGAPALTMDGGGDEIGRASCRERV